MADAAILKQIVDSSAQLTTWALAVGGGTVAMLVSTSYRRPDKRWRSSYLLFLPGWAFIGHSLYAGHQLTGKYLAALVSPKLVPAIAQQINDWFSRQQDALFLSLVFFSAWLILYLINWIYSDTLDKGDRK